MSLRGRRAARVPSVLDFKQSARLATTGNITLSGLQTIDGVAGTAGDRVLVKDQSTGSENGPYFMQTGAWVRTSDADVRVEVTSGLKVFISEGTANATSTWVLTTVDPIVLGTTALTFVQLPAGDADTLDGLDSTAFAILAGQAGGQVLNGGTASGEDLTLSSTAHATKGSILFGTSAYDEVNNRLGIQTANPSSSLHVFKTGAVGVVIIAEQDSSLTTEAGNVLLSLRNRDTTANNRAEIEFMTEDTSGGLIRAAEIVVIFPSRTASNAAGELSFLTRSTSDANPVERMRIDDTGQVGIGKDPAQMLDVEGTGGTRISVTNTNNTNGAVVQAFNDGGDAIFITAFGTGVGNFAELSASGGMSRLTLNTPSSIPITFETNNLERMSLEGGGNLRIFNSVKIGADSAPTEEVDITGDLIVSGFSAFGSAAAVTAVMVVRAEHTFTTNSALGNFGVRSVVDETSTSGTTSIIAGSFNATASFGGTASGTLATILVDGTLNSTENFASGAFRNLRSQLTTSASQTGTVASAEHIMLLAPTYTGSSPTDGYGINIANQGASGVTTSRAINIQAQSGSTNNRGLVSLTLNNFMAGLRIGASEGDPSGSRLHVEGTTLLDGELDHDGTTAGFFSAAPVTQRSAIAALTNSMGDTTTDGTLEAIGDTSASNQAAPIERNLSELNASVNSLRQVFIDLGLTA